MRDALLATRQLTNGNKLADYYKRIYRPQQCIFDKAIELLKFNREEFLLQWAQTKRFTTSALEISKLYNFPYYLKFLYGQYLI